MDGIRMRDTDLGRKHNQQQQKVLLDSFLLPFWKGCMLSHLIVYDERRQYGNSDKMNSKLTGRISRGSL